MPQLSTAVAIAVLTLCCIWAANLRHVMKSSIYCEMTYMYPEYRDVLANELDTKHYKLKQYLEGWPVRQGGEEDSTPVLFIPGNAASYAQVRSLAAESWRIYSRSQQPLSPMQYKSLQWYAVDTGEQFSAFHGQLMESQVNFSVSALQYLAKRYRSSSSLGSPIIVVGHSMGGIVARAAVQRLYDLGNIQGTFPVCLVLTLSSPHQRGPLVLHPLQAQVYDTLKLAAWPPVPVLSISAGDTDMQVPVLLTSLTGLVPAHLGFHADMQHVRSVWTGADHQMVVWCNQLVSRLAQLLLEMVLQMDNALSHEGQSAALLTLARERLSANVSNHLGLTPEALDRLTTPVSPAGVDPASDRADPTSDSSSSSSSGVDESFAKKMGASDERGHGAVPEEAGCPPRVRAATECMGPNLAWHQQYLKAKLVKTKLIALDKSKVKASKLGKLWSWNLTKLQSSSDTSLFALVSGMRPCDDWKIWLIWGDSVCSASNITDVTTLAAPAPPVYDSAKPVVRKPSTSEEVFAGRDYSGAGSWVLRFNSQELKGTARLVLWVATKELPAGFHVTVQVHSGGVAHVQLPSWALATGVHIPKGSPAVSLVTFGASKPLVRLLELGLSVSSSNPSSSQHSCWRPLLVDAGGAQANTAQPVVALDGLYPLGPPASLDRLLLLTDPRCSHFISLQSTILANPARLLLTHAAAITGLMLALSSTGLPFSSSSSSAADSATRAMKSPFTKLALISCMIISVTVTTLPSTAQRTGLDWSLFPSPALQLLLLGVAVTLLKVLGVLLGVLVVLLAWPVGAVHYVVWRARRGDGPAGRSYSRSMVALPVAALALLAGRVQQLDLPPATILPACWLLLLLSGAWQRCTRWRTLGAAVPATTSTFDSWLLWHTCGTLVWMPSVVAWIQANGLFGTTQASSTTGFEVLDWAAVLGPALLAAVQACNPPQADSGAVWSWQCLRERGKVQQTMKAGVKATVAGDAQGASDGKECVKGGDADCVGGVEDTGTSNSNSAECVESRPEQQGETQLFVSGLTRWLDRLLYVLRGAVGGTFIVCCFSGVAYVGVYVQGVLGLVEGIVAAVGGR